MKKILSALVLLSLITMVGCTSKDEQNENTYFNATELEVREGSVSVEPIDGEEAKEKVSFVEVKEYDSVDVIEKFFDAFAEADYETMRKYCTKECQDSFFHKGDVDGMVWAKLVRIDEDNYLDEPQNMCVEVEAEFVPESSQYGGDSSTSFFVELVKGESGEWLIDSFPTG